MLNPHKAVYLSAAFKSNAALKVHVKCACFNLTHG